MVTFGAELEDAAAEEPELHAELHQHAEVSVRECLEGGDRAARLASTPVRFVESETPDAFRGQDPQGRAAIVKKAVESARQSLELRLFEDARNEAAFALELDSNNAEARDKAEAEGFEILGIMSSSSSLQTCMSATTAGRNPSSLSYAPLSADRTRRSTTSLAWRTSGP